MKDKPLRDFETTVYTDWTTDATSGMHPLLELVLFVPMLLMLGLVVFAVPIAVVGLILLVLALA